jgi:hypothetical protein
VKRGGTDKKREREREREKKEKVAKNSTEITRQLWLENF